MDAFNSELRRVYWETTAGCNLRCIHCRRVDVLTKGSPDELTTDQAKGLVDQLSGLGKPVLILSGGEPLFRRDIFEIAAYGAKSGLPVALSTNGTLVNAALAKRLKEAGVYYASISLDGAGPATHDAFRGKGNFEKAVRGMTNLQDVGIKVQINFTVTKANVDEVSQIYELAHCLEAAALYLFLLVPVGCGVQIAQAQMLSPREVEDWLGWVLKKDKDGPLPIKAICAPHYYRIELENGSQRPTSNSSRKGCLAGIHMCFISHKGDVFPCGYLPVSAGNVKTKPLGEIWIRSQIFEELRDPRLLEGRCGQCPFKGVCGGCRARALYSHQSILAEEPYCAYEPAVA